MVPGVPRDPRDVHIPGVPTPGTTGMLTSLGSLGSPGCSPGIIVKGVYPCGPWGPQGRPHPWGPQDFPQGLQSWGYIPVVRMVPGVPRDYTDLRDFHIPGVPRNMAEPVKPPSCSNLHFRGAFNADWQVTSVLRYRIKKLKLRCKGNCTFNMQRATTYTTRYLFLRNNLIGQH